MTKCFYLMWIVGLIYDSNNFNQSGMYSLITITISVNLCVN